MTDGSRILLVEDDADSGATTARILNILGVNQVRVVRDGRSVLETALEFRPDAILVDIGLPDIDGYEIARRLRKNSELATVHLIAHTGYGFPEDCRRALEAGFDEHLLKPASIDTLQSLLKRLGLIRTPAGP